MPEEEVKIKILKINQNIGEFYVGVAKAKDVTKICSAEERRATWDDLEKYIGMQRPLSDRRVEEIKTYIKTKDATFPNSIILALKKESFRLDGDFLYVKKQKKSTNIIDGQHRLAGFLQEGEDFELIVTFFPDLSLEDQAYLFSVINTKQTRINPSLAHELYDLAKLETPQRVVHNLTVEFNNNEKSPWYHKIKRLGKREPFGEEIISQNTFAKEIIELVCNSKHSYLIRDELKKDGNDRKKLITIKEFSYNPEVKIFWEPYTDKRDDFIFNVLKSFFCVIRDNFPNEWGNDDFILTKTTGYSAMMKLFKQLYKKGFNKEKNLTYNFFDSYIKKAKEKKKFEFTSKVYNPGKTGESKLYQDFLKAAELR